MTGPEAVRYALRALGGVGSPLARRRREGASPMATRCSRIRCLVGLLAVVAASESEFVRKLDAFLEAGREHIDYICQRIPEFEPDFGEVCQTLHDAYTCSLPSP